MGERKAGLPVCKRIANTASRKSNRLKMSAPLPPVRAQSLYAGRVSCFDLRVTLIQRPRWLSLNAALGILALLVAVAGGSWGIWAYYHPGRHQTEVQLGKLMSIPSPRGRCFNDDQNRKATLRFGDATASHANGVPFLQCGHTDNPALADGEYKFIGKTFKPDAQLVALKTRVGIDEGSFKTQHEAVGIWTVFYYGEQVCTETARYGNPKPFTCPLPDHPADLSQLRIEQHLTRSDRSQGAGLWAGLIDPIVVVKEPS